MDIQQRYVDRMCFGKRERVGLSVKAEAFRIGQDLADIPYRILDKQHFVI